MAVGMLGDDGIVCGPKRRSPSTSMSKPHPSRPAAASLCAMWQLRYLVEVMIRDGVLTFSEANLLASAASDADLLNLPLRGRRTGR